MICYLVTERGRDTMDRYLATWGAAVAERIAVVSYESLVRRSELPAAGAYIFSDIERLTPVRRQLAIDARARVDAANGAARVLNHPAQSLRRYELLRLLHQRGGNRFEVRRASKPLDGLRYPVFVRLENDHGGSRTALLHDAATLHRAIHTLGRIHGRDELLVTEFCDTADDEGVYRKYAAFVVGDRIIPRHVLFGRNWMRKEPELSDDRLAREQRAYVEANPHAARLRQICGEARIDYGRVDYSLLDGEIQVWEINTNPTILQHPDTYHARNLPTHERFAERIGAAFAALAGDEDAAGEPVALDFGRGASAALAWERFGQWRGRRRTRLVRWWVGRDERMRGGGGEVRL